MITTSLILALLASIAIKLKTFSGGPYGATGALATPLMLSAVVNCIGIGFQRGT